MNLPHLRASRPDRTIADRRGCPASSITHLSSSGEVWLVVFNHADVQLRKSVIGKKKPERESGLSLPATGRVLVYEASRLPFCVAS